MKLWSDRTDCAHHSDHAGPDVQIKRRPQLIAQSPRPHSLFPHVRATHEAVAWWWALESGGGG